MEDFPVCDREGNMRSYLYITTLFMLIGAINCYEPIKIEIPEDGSTLRIFSNDDISRYDGTDAGEPIYMAIKGVVFDVTSGKDFYGKGMSYNALVGKDSTRAVAKMSLEPQDLTSDISGLSDSYLKSLDDIYKSTYLAKYPIEGYMDYLLNDKERALFRDEF